MSTHHPAKSATPPKETRLFGYHLKPLQAPSSHHWKTPSKVSSVCRHTQACVNVCIVNKTTVRHPQLLKCVARDCCRVSGWVWCFVPMWPGRVVHCVSFVDVTLNLMLHNMKCCLTAGCTVEGSAS